MVFLFFIKKVITLLLLPLGFCLIIFLLSLIFKNKGLKLFGIFVLIFFSNNITNQILWGFLEHPYQRSDEKEVKKGDYIVVLSSSRYRPPGNNNIFEWNDPDRFIAGINLFKAKKGSSLLFTGGANPYKSKLPLEGNIYKKEAIELGIPKDLVFTTKKVYNTFQESIEIADFIKKKGLSKRRIILVTSAYHMKRSKKLFERQGLIVQEFPVDFKSNKIRMSNILNPINFIPNAASLSASSEALREILGRIFYKTF